MGQPNRRWPTGSKRPALDVPREVLRQACPQSQQGEGEVGHQRRLGHHLTGMDAGGGVVNVPIDVKKT